MRSFLFDIIKEAIEDLNDELQFDHLNNIDEHTPLYSGDDLSIDSLSLVTLIAEIELKLTEDFQRKVILADEKAMSMKNSPYQNVGSLLNLIETRLEAKDV